MARIDLFLTEIGRRLEEGSREYGDRSFGRSAADIMGELREEAFDVPGWLFVLVEKFNRMGAGQRCPGDLEVVKREALDICAQMFRLVGRLEDLGKHAVELEGRLA